MPKIARRNYSPDQERDDNGEFGSGGGGGGGGSGGDKGTGGKGPSPEESVKSEITKAVPGAKSVSVTLDDENETWHATVDGTKYKMDIGSDDDNMSFKKVGKGAGPKTISFPIPDSFGANVKHNCGCGGTCCGNKMKTWKSNLATSEITYKKKGNTTYMVVPVVMAKSDVVMNGSLTSESELVPQGWNGRPVTVGHPNANGEFMSANATPTTDQDWQIGTLYNTTLKDGSLKAEAWIDMAKANALDPDLVARLKEGDKIDVSTGYFCDEEPTSGTSNGREYTTIARNIVPDHLAILPNEEGACNWEDGCGVRANKRRLRKMAKTKSETALGKILKACGLDANSKEAKKIASAIEELVPNARGADDDSRQIAADLISNDESPFTPDDQDSLHAMTPDTLKAIKEKFLPKPDAANADDESDDDEEDPSANADGDEPDEDDQSTDDTDGKKSPAANKEKRMSKGLKAHIDAAVKAALSGVLSPEDRLAINTAKGITANRKKELVEKIVKNSTMKKAEVEKLDLSVLELIANGLHEPAADYSGRAVPTVNEDDEIAKSMAGNSLGAVLRERNKGARH